MKSIDASKIGFYFTLFVVVFFTGVFTGRLQRHEPGNISMDGSSENLAKQLAEQTPIAIEMGMQPLFDFNSAESNNVLNAVLTDWFNNPKHRLEPLKLLVDPSVGPFAESQPTIKKVIVDSQMVRGSFQPNIPGITTLVADGAQGVPLKSGELGIKVDRYAVLPMGRLSVGFSVSNQSGVAKSVQYLATKSEAGWNVQLVLDE